jgi:hypothetical protein
LSLLIGEGGRIGIDARCHEHRRAPPVEDWSRVLAENHLRSEKEVDLAADPFIDIYMTHDEYILQAPFTRRRSYGASVLTKDLTISEHFLPLALSRVHWHVRRPDI